MIFYDVRLKQYIEIRLGDSMPIEYALAYAAFIKGIFCSSATLEQLYTQCNVTVKDIEEAKENIMKEGYDSIIYNRNTHQWTLELFYMAMENLDYASL